MANDIAVQFPHLPADQAVTAIAAHIRKFWDPRMKSELLNLANTDPDSFNPLALEATKQLA